MIKATLVEFLQKGRLGPLRMGVSRHRVASLLGRPTDKLAGLDLRDSAIWVFGSVEVGFDPGSHRLGFLQVERLNHRGRFEGCRRLVLSDDGFDAGKANVAAFERFARRHGVPLLAISPPWRDAGQICFATPGGVVAWFAKDVDSGCTRFDSFTTEDVSSFEHLGPSIAPMWLRSGLRSGRAP